MSVAAESQKPAEKMETESSEVKCFGERLNELPVVNAAVDQLSSLYSGVRDKNSVTRFACEAGESYIRFLSAAASLASGPLVKAASSVTKVDDPVGALDNMASETLAKVEEKFPIITKTPSEIANITKDTVVTGATSVYDKVQSSEVTKAITGKAQNVVAMSELLVEMALPTDGNNAEDMKELEEDEQNESRDLVVRTKTLGSRVRRRGANKLMNYQPVKLTVDAIQYCQEKLTALVHRSGDATENTHPAYMYIPHLATRLSGEVIVSGKEFVFALTHAHSMKDMPACVLEMTKKAVQPLSDITNKAIAHVYVPTQVMAEYVLSSRPIQWVIPNVVSVEDMSNMEISMEEIVEDDSDTEDAETEKESANKENEKE